MPLTPDEDIEVAARAELRMTREGLRREEATRRRGDTNTGPVLDQSPIAARGAALLNEIAEFLARFISYPSEHAKFAHVLWIAHTHLMDVWDSTPRIAFLSPEPASGKTRALEVTGLLVPRPVESINATPAYLFRKVSDPEGPPTILFDEIDTVFGPRAKENEEVRGMLNAGHRKGATAGRCVLKGKEIVTEDLPAYCAVAMAGLGTLPDTILTRSIIIRMRRRAPGEIIEPYRRRKHAAMGYDLRDRLTSWARDCRLHLTDAELPPEITDRPADVWESLFAIAEACQGNWPTRVREAALAFVTDSRDVSASLGVRLLSDIRTVFGDHDVMFTRDLVRALNELDEAPWGNLKGSELDARGLAHRLKPYGISRADVYDGTDKGKGYERKDFLDAWNRYLPDAPAANSVESVESVEFRALPKHDTANSTDSTDSTDSPASERAISDSPEIEVRL